MDQTHYNLSKRHALTGIAFSLLLGSIYYFIELQPLLYYFTIPVIVSLFNYLFIKEKNIDLHAALAVLSFGSIGVISKYEYPQIPFEFSFIALIFSTMTGFSKIHTRNLILIIIFITAIAVWAIGIYLPPKHILENWQSNAILISILLYSSLATLQVYKNVKKEQNNYINLLKEQKEQITAQNQKIRTQHLEILNIQKEKHEKELELQQRDIELLQTANTIKLKVQKTILTQLEEMLSSEKELQKKLRSMSLDLRNQIETDKKIEFDQTHFAKINHVFYERLSNLYPALTKTELEICSYLKLGLSSKEIASIRSSSINSVDVSKNRIRKKIKIETKNDLVIFMKQL